MIKINSLSKVNYLKNNNEGTLVLFENEEQMYKYSLKYMINTICKLHLTSLSAYNTALNKNFNYKYNNPVVFKNIILVKVGNVNSYDSIWFNYNNVFKFNLKDNQTIIEFKSGDTLIINKSINYLKKQSKKIKEIKRYLFKL